MKTKAKAIRPTPEEAIAIQRGIDTDPDNPELTREEIRSMRPYRDVMAEYERKRVGRPPKEMPKVSVTIRYDADVLERFRSTGDGWQTRMNDALRTYLDERVVRIKVKDRL